MIETIPSGTILYGHYRIERVLGSGGFGHVYLAVDLNSNQPCAVKEYLVSGASGQEQLKHEATVLSQLHHPNLPAFLDAFMEQGRYFVVLNYIEGHDLTDLIRMARQRNEMVPIAQIIGWILSMCDAVTFLHNQRPIVIHRDIKPDNIRITSNGTAILVDLGNAKAAADGARTLFFIRHQGTPGYAPPEQYPGGSGTDARSDVYALGATLYFALTGHEPPSVSARNQSIQQRQPDLPSLQERLGANPPKPTHPEDDELHKFRLGVSKPTKPAPRHSKHLAQLATLHPEVLKQLNAIIQRAMAMKPRERYQYIADFANDLKKVMAALPAPPQPPTPPGRPVDPHSTQPDLPLLYDTLQEAKDKASQGNVSSTATVSYCPRCNAQLIPLASFCPRCGTSLDSTAQNMLVSSHAAPSDIAGEKTVVVKQSGLAAQVRPTPVTTIQHSDHTVQSSSPPHQQNMAVHVPTARASRIASLPSSRSGSAANSIAQSQSQATGMDVQTSSGSSTSTRLIIISVIIIVLILIIILLLFSHHPLHSHAPALPGLVQEMLKAPTSL